MKMNPNYVKSEEREAKISEEECNMANNEVKQLEEQYEGKSKDFIIGAIIGGAVGALTALLLAPKSGKELRNDLADQVETIKGKTDHLRIAVTQKGNDLAATTKEKTIQLKDLAVDKGSQLVGTVKDKAEKLQNKVENEEKEEKDESYDEEFI